VRRELVEDALKPREPRADTARQHPFSHRRRGLKLEQALTDSQTSQQSMIRTLAGGPPHDAL